jgi:hypothetical protein
LCAKAKWVINDCPGPLRYDIADSLAARHGLGANARTLALRFVNAIEAYRDCHIRSWEQCSLLATKIPGLQDRSNIHLFEECAAQLESLKRGTLWQFPNERRYDPDLAWKKAAGLLPEFSKSSWKSWAKMAWKVIVAVSPEGRPDLEPILIEGPGRICNVRRERNDPYFANKIRKSPGVATSDVKEAFFTAFEEIATSKSKRNR